MLWAATGMGYTGHVPSAGNFTMLDFLHLPELRSTKKVRTLLMSLKVFHRSKYSQIANAARGSTLDPAVEAYSAHRRHVYVYVMHTIRTT